MHTIRVSKQFSFDMAHALFGYDGPCKNIHGHTYHLIVTIRGEVIDENNNAKQGMVLDFSDLKKIVRDNIIDKFDHALVLNGNAAEHVHLEGQIKEQFGSIILLEKQPTCENLLLHFKDILLKFYNGAHQLVYVKLQETPNSFAEWHLSDQ